MSTPTQISQEAGSHSTVAGRTKPGLATRILQAPKWLLSLILPVVIVAVWQYVTVSGIVAPWRGARCGR